MKSFTALNGVYLGRLHANIFVLLDVCVAIIVNIGYMISMANKKFAFGM